MRYQPADRSSLGTASMEAPRNVTSTSDVRSRLAAEMPPAVLRTDIHASSAPEPGRLADDPYQRTFPATADQAGEARRFLTGILGDHPATDDAVACLSELAGNAIKHGRSAQPGGTFHVRFRRAGPAIRIEVTDQGGPWRARADGDEERGRGLRIVRKLSARQGITVKGPRDNPNERTVWFDIAPP